MVRWAGLRADAPTWLYDFRWVHAGTGLAFHCAELPFGRRAWVANASRTRAGRTPRRSGGGAMHGVWVEFVRLHRAPWPEWSEDAVAMVFDDAPAARPAYELEWRLALKAG